MGWSTLKSRTVGKEEAARMWRHRPARWRELELGSQLAVKDPGETGEVDATCGLTLLDQTMGLCKQDVSGLHPQKTNCLVDREENFLTHLRDKAEEESGLKLRA